MSHVCACVEGTSVSVSVSVSVNVNASAKQRMLSLKFFRGKLRGECIECIAVRGRKKNSSGRRKGRMRWSGVRVERCGMMWYDVV